METTQLVLSQFKNFLSLPLPKIINRRCELVKLCHITGSALALHCCKAHAKINGKIENSTPCKIVTHEDFNLKLGTHDYVADATHHATLGLNRPSGSFPSNRGNITPV